MTTNEEIIEKWKKDNSVMYLDKDTEYTFSYFIKQGIRIGKSQATKEILEDLDIINNLIRSRNYPQAGNHCIRLKQQLKKLGENNQQDKTTMVVNSISDNGINSEKQSEILQDTSVVLDKTVDNSYGKQGGLHTTSHKNLKEKNNES